MYKAQFWAKPLAVGIHTSITYLKICFYLNFSLVQLYSLPNVLNSCNRHSNT